MRQSGDRRSGAGDGAAFGENLRAARLRAELTQQALAKLAGIDRATISLIENGREQPRADTVVRLADVLGVSPADLWRGGALDERAVQHRSLREEAVLRYEPLEDRDLHPGLRDLLDDADARLLYRITPEEAEMLRSIRTRRDAPLGRDFFLDVLAAYRRHHGD